MSYGERPGPEKWSKSEGKKKQEEALEKGEVYRSGRKTIDILLPSTRSRRHSVVESEAPAGRKRSSRLLSVGIHRTVEGDRERKPAVRVVTFSESCRSEARRCRVKQNPHPTMPRARDWVVRLRGLHA